MSKLIPLVNLNAQYISIKEEIDQAIAEVIKSSSYIRGPHVNAFEAAWSKMLGVNYCVSCANGTDALYIVFKMCNLGPGDEVITSSHSWIATSETISQTGARVVFADTLPDTFTIDPDDVARKITNRTKAIVPVHLYGQPADMDAILELSRKHDLLVIEDCAQAHLAEYKGRMVGTIGHAATFSFYPGKNLGAMGDAGCLVTNDRDLAQKCRRFANHGSLQKHDHEIEGINSRMDGLQAAVLNVKLKYIEEWTRLRIQHAQTYNQLLAGTDSIVLPVVSPEVRHVFHLFVVKVNNRKRIAEALNQLGIQTAIQYPVALPFLKAYEHLDAKPADYPNAFSNQHEILSLPMYPELTEHDLKFVTDSLLKVSSTT